jgi:ethanolamine utilization protein EutN
LLVEIKFPDGGLRASRPTVGNPINNNLSQEETDLKIGTVTGSIWATRKASCLSGQTFLVVRTSGEDLVAVDQVGAGTGDRVLLVTGECAARYCMDAPMDAVVVAIIDGKQES